VIKLASLFSNHAVLQQEMPLAIWGWGNPQELVQLKFAKEEIWVVSDSQGKFTGYFNARPAGGPFTLTVTGQSGEKIEATDIYVGEVWIAGGQSNMEMPLTGFETPLPQEELEQLKFTQPIRAFIMDRSMPQIASLQHHCDLKAEWLPLEEENYPKWSACAAFFAADLTSKLHVPCGILSCNLGGTIIETWLSFKKLWYNPEQRAALMAYENRIHSLEFKDNFLPKWPSPSMQESIYGYLTQKVFEENNIDVNQPPEGRELPEFDDSQWQEVKLPGVWQLNMKIQEPGIVWYRKEIQIPPAWEGKQLLLEIGAADKQDTTYFNGTIIGRTGKNFEFDYWNFPRKYTILPQCFHSGRAILAIRVFSHMFSGGLTGPADQMRLRCPECPGTVISLAGTWRAQMTLSLKSIQIRSMMGYRNPNSFHMLFDSMVRPLIPYAVRGVIWYQGEGNQSNYEQYDRLIKDLIEDWRERWHQPEFAFLQVLLAGWVGEEGEGKHWPEIRQAQINSARITKTGFASAVDLGDKMNIHPLQKRILGKRLALRALSDVYGMNIVSRGPEVRTAIKEGNVIRVEFNFAEGLNSRDGQPDCIEISDDDKNYMKADATIEKNTILVKFQANTKFIRYAWYDYPETANLYNGAGLPMLPFKLKIRHK
jgi:sialate O-acetylesterase